MSRFLFYTAVAGMLAVSVAQAAVAVASLAPDPSVQRESWRRAPSTAPVMQLLGPFHVPAAILCTVVNVATGLLDGAPNP